jgi:hypothetical protein
MSVNRPAPIVLSLLVCRRIIRDAMSNEYSIIGITSELAVPSFPITAPMFFAFAELTGVHGDVELVFRIIDANEDRPPVAEVKGGGAIADGPLGVAQLAVGMAGLVFPEPGEYRLQLSSRGTLLAERKFRMVPLKGPQ